MKLSEATLTILDNFSKINTGIVIPAGNTITTVSATGNLIARAKIEESFPTQIALYNLPEFLNVANLFQGAEVEISEKDIQFSSPSGGAVITQSVPNIILHFPHEKLPNSETVASFIMPQNVLQTIPKTQLTLLNVMIVGDGSKIEVQLRDASNSASTILKFNVGTTKEVFKANLLAQPFTKIIKTQSEFEVDVTKKFVKLHNKEASLTYLITLERDSKI